MVFILVHKWKEIWRLIHSTWWSEAKATLINQVISGFRTRIMRHLRIMSSKTPPEGVSHISLGEESLRRDRIAVIFVKSWHAVGGVSLLSLWEECKELGSRECRFYFSYEVRISQCIGLLNNEMVLSSTRQWAKVIKWNLELVGVRSWDSHKGTKFQWLNKYGESLILHQCGAAGVFEPCDYSICWWWAHE